MPGRRETAAALRPPRVRVPGQEPMVPQAQALEPVRAQQAPGQGQGQKQRRALARVRLPRPEPG